MEPSKDNPLEVAKFINEAKKEDKAVIIRPYELLRSSGGMYCFLDRKKISKASELAELGCSASDIRNALGLNSSQYNSYLNQGRLVEAYLLGAGIDVDADPEWESKVPNGFELEDEDGQLVTIHQGLLKYKFYKAIQEGRARGSELDLKKIRAARDNDWKAAAYTLERRNPEYKKERLPDISQNPQVVINNTTNNNRTTNNLIQNIRTLAKELEEQDRKRGLLKDSEQVVDVTVKGEN